MVHDVEEPACDSIGDFSVKAFDKRVLRLFLDGSSLLVWPWQAGSVTARGTKSKRDVAVPGGGVLPSPSAASTVAEVGHWNHPRASGSRFLGRRVDPQAEIGRRARGERVAKPAPLLRNFINPRSKSK